MSICCCYSDFVVVVVVVFLVGFLLKLVVVIVVICFVVAALMVTCGFGCALLEIRSLADTWCSRGGYNLDVFVFCFVCSGLVLSHNHRSKLDCVSLTHSASLFLFARVASCHSLSPFDWISSAQIRLHSCGANLPWHFSSRQEQHYIQDECHFEVVTLPSFKLCLNMSGLQLYKRSVNLGAESCARAANLLKFRLPTECQVAINKSTHTHTLRGGPLIQILLHPTSDCHRGRTMRHLLVGTTLHKHLGSMLRLEVLPLGLDFSWLVLLPLPKLLLPQTEESHCYTSAMAKKSRNSSLVICQSQESHHQVS